jgi:GNAT superfamily N-acetyltransferase
VDVEVLEYGTSDTEAIEAGRLVINAIRAAETPWLLQMTAHRRRMEVQHGWDGAPERHFLGRVDGIVIATGSLEFGEWDNLDLAWCSVLVRPERRRQGHGSALLSHLMQEARNHGSRSFGADGWELDGVEEFAAGHGLRVRNAGVHSIQLVRELGAGLVDRLHDEAAQHAKEYELLRLEAPSPEELLPELAELTAAINDAPIGDLDIEPENFPVQRIRAYERSQLASGRRIYRVVARHRASRRLAGHTVVAVDADQPEYGDQHDTSVLREHRGHRLGMLLKTEMLRWLAEVEPELRRIDTWNDQDNDHMLAVNERLGYRRTSRNLEFQRDL